MGISHPLFYFNLQISSVNFKISVVVVSAYMNYASKSINLKIVHHVTEL